MLLWLAELGEIGTVRMPIISDSEHPPRSLGIARNANQCRRLRVRSRGLSRNALWTSNTTVDYPVQNRSFISVPCSPLFCICPPFSIQFYFTANELSALCITDPTLYILTFKRRYFKNTLTTADFTILNFMLITDFRELTSPTLFNLSVSTHI